MIDYQILADALTYYGGLGYQRVEAPWTVTSAISGITRPPGGTDWTIMEKDKVLVASGEQSFLYLYLKGFLPKGRFITVTPCFRNESFDLTHTKYFMKAELIDTLDVDMRSLTSMVIEAFMFFREQFKNPLDLEIVKTGDSSIDILWRGHELGSYGIRSCEFLKWIYGTGVAEPRLSTLRAMDDGLSYD